MLHVCRIHVREGKTVYGLYDEFLVSNLSVQIEENIGRKTVLRRKLSLIHLERGSQEFQSRSYNFYCP